MESDFPDSNVTVGAWTLLLVVTSETAIEGLLEMRERLGVTFETLQVTKVGTSAIVC